MKKRGRLFKGKKGIQEILLVEAMQLLAVAIVLMSVLFFVNAKFSKVGFAKTFYSRDIALMTTAFAGAPGLMAYDYYVQYIDPDNPGEQTFHFFAGDNVIKVNASESPRQNVYWFFSGPSSKINFDKNEIAGKSVFIREDGEVRLGDYNDINERAIMCSSIDTEDNVWKQRMFIIDSAHGENSTDKGNINSADNTFYEEQITSNIAKRMSISENNKIYTRKQGEYARLSKRESVVANTASTAMIISIHAGSSKDVSENYIKAYYNSNSNDEIKDKSRKLGCKILNSITDYEKLRNNNKINGVVVVPSDSDYITKLIPEGRIGVLLEFGNIQIPKAENFISDTTHLAEAISHGIGEYYS